MLEFLNRRAGDRRTVSSLLNTTGLAALVSVGLAISAFADELVDNGAVRTITSPEVIAGTLEIGQDATGTLVISDPGTLTGETGVLGRNASGFGQATVSGPDAFWSNVDVYLGYGGRGQLDIFAGGQVSALTLYMAGLTGSTGNAVVSGTGSELLVSGAMFVGERGNGTLTIEDGGYVRSGVGNVGALFENGVRSEGTVTVNGPGSVWDNDENLYVGRDGNGTVVLSDGGTVNVGGGTGVVDIAEAPSSIGTVVLGSALGTAPATAGNLNVNEVRFGAGTGSLVFNHSSALSFDPLLTGNGTVIHGAGLTEFIGSSAGFTGQTDVEGGTLLVNGTLGGAVDVSGGRLGGGGTTGALSVLSGGTLAPGNSIGTLTVSSATFDSGSIFEVELDGGAADQLVVNGTATLNGGTVMLVAGPGPYDPATTYTILTSATRIGQFDNVVDDFAFLTPTLDYVGDDVVLNLAAAFSGNDEQTPNENAVGGALDALGPDAPYYAEMIGLDEASGKAALNQLTGEGYAAINGLMIEDSRYVRDAVLSRLDAPANNRPGFWGQFYGGLTRLAGDGNAAQSDAAAGGLVMGLDAAFGNTGRAGFVIAAGNSDFENRNTDADSTDLSVGAYGATMAGPLAIELGAAYTRHSVDSTRIVDFTVTPDLYSASYSAGTTQGFVEVSHDFDLDSLTLSPFGALTAISQSSDTFNETGGVAALGVSSQTTNALMTTLGLGFAHSQDLAGGNSLVLSGSAGWRHVFADEPTTQNSLPGGSAFEIAGPSLATDSLSLDAAIDLTLAEGITLGAAYGGQLSDSGSSHAFKASLTGSF